MKTQAKLESRKLRKAGRSVNEIASTVGVAKSSVSRWVRDVKMSAPKMEALRKRQGSNAGPEARRFLAREKRKQWQEEGRTAARAQNWLHLAGCMLFWAEGARRRNDVRFTNSDLDMVIFFMRFVREALKVPDEKIVITIHCHTTNGLSAMEIEHYWLAKLGLRLENLRKTQINKTSKWSKKRGNVLKYGTCNVIIHSTRLSQHLHGAIQEYSGSSKDSWLD